MENYEKAERDYMGGMKYKDIAEKYGTTINTVKSWKNRYGWNREEDAHKTEKVCKQKEKGVQAGCDISWIEIEHEYVTDISRKPCSLENLAKKYSVSVKSVQQHCQDEEWVKKRNEYRKSIGQKALEKSADKDADRIARLLEIADMATDKAERAIKELEQYVVRDKKRTRTVEYKDDKAIGKPTKEVIDDTEHVRMETGPVDRLGLSQVTSALKNIKELYALPVDMESKKYQAELDRRKAEKEGGESAEYESDGFMEALQGDVTATFKEDDSVET